MIHHQHYQASIKIKVKLYFVKLYFYTCRICFLFHCCLFIIYLYRFAVKKVVQNTITTTTKVFCFTADPFSNLPNLVRIASVYRNVADHARPISTRTHSSLF